MGQSGVFPGCCVCLHLSLGRPHLLAPARCKHILTVFLVPLSTPALTVPVLEFLGAAGHLHVVICLKAKKSTKVEVEVAMCGCAHLHTRMGVEQELPKWAPGALSST
jgi:hypothetical protein